MDPKLKLSLDLATEDGVRAYIAQTPFDSTDIKPLSGGTANYVYRLLLKVPHRGRETLVLKHAKPYVKDYKTLQFALERQVSYSVQTIGLIVYSNDEQIYEVAALKHVREWVPVESVVTVPEVHLFDEVMHVIIMDDAGDNAVPLKEFLKQGEKVTISLATEIGKALGTFLSGMHSWGQANKDVRDAVKGNSQAKEMSTWAFYGRLVETLSGNSGVPKLLDPPLTIGKEELEVIEQVARETTELLMNADDSFVMGDFWPGNLMIQLDEESKLKSVSVLDWELAKTGLISADIGQFCAEIHLLRRCYPDICKDTASAVLETFLAEYKRVGKPSPEVVRRSLIQVGTHMAVLGGRVDWGDKEMTREVVIEGAEIVVEGYKSKDLEASVLAALL